MGTYKAEIQLKLPSCNEYINACRNNRYAAATMKKEVEEQIQWFIKKLPKMKKPVFITFTWIEENKKRDLDGICFAKKFILDAMQKAGILENDNAAHVKGFIDKFEYANQSKVIVELREIE